jgi:predicted dehydrogenase
MGKIKAAVIGTGFTGEAHVEAVRRLGVAEVVALVGSSEEKAKEKAAEWGIPKAYGDYREMLADPEIQVVHNCTPNHVHHEINKAIILAGKHVLSEKPLAVTSEESAELLRLAEERGVVHAVNFNYRQFPMVRNLAAMVRGGELGRIYLIQGGYLQDWLLYDTDYNWRLDTEVGGRSRAIADIGSHWCDTVQFVTGLKIRSVFADLTTVHPVRRKPAKQVATFERQADTALEDVTVSTEDFASVLVRFEGGAKGAFTVSQVSAGRKNHLTFEVSGERKSVYWNQEEPEKAWIGYRDKANEVLLADPSLAAGEARANFHYPGGHNEGWPDSLKNQMMHFYSRVLSGRGGSGTLPEFATFADGHDLVRITEAILESHARQAWVDL